MMDSEDELVVLADISSPSLNAFRDLLREDVNGEASEAHQNPELREDQPLALLADVALAPSCAMAMSCSCPGVSGVTESWLSIQLQHKFFLRRVDDLEEKLINGNGNQDIGALTAAVASLLYTCQPYFNHLESTARGTVSMCAHKPAEFCSKLLSFSQQLCDRLEELLLTYTSYNLISLDEAEYNSISHFCIGQIQLGQMNVISFRYCRPTPYMSRVDTGVYKRMRWNVERLQENQQRGYGEETDFYFLCFEDIPNTHVVPDSESEDASNDDVVRMWSIGRWVQVIPDPIRGDIYDWILCEVPEASYRRLLFLGRNEPTSCMATDYLLQLLLSSSCNTY